MIYSLEWETAYTGAFADAGHQQGTVWTSPTDSLCLGNSGCSGRDCVKHQKYEEPQSVISLPPYCAAFRNQESQPMGFEKEHDLPLSNGIKETSGEVAENLAQKHVFHQDSFQI